MLVEVFILFIILAFVFLIIGIYIGSSGSNNPKEGNADKKSGVPIIFLLLSAILFLIVSLNSQSVTDDFCENQVVQANVSGNTTDYANQISCSTQRYSMGYLGGIFAMLIIFDIVMMLVYLVKEFL